MQSVADFPDLLSQFMGGNPAYLLAWCAGLLLVARIGKEGREVGLFAFLLLVLMVFNPGSYGFLTGKYGFTSTYYRFLWVVPCTPLVAYLVYEATLNIDGTKRRMIVVAAICAVVILSNVKMENFKHPENPYQIPNEIIELDEQLESLMASRGETQANIVSDLNVSNVIRQYDAHICLQAPLDGAATLDPAQTSEDPWGLMSMLCNDRNDIPADAVGRIVDNYQIDFLIPPKANANFLAHVQGMGWQVVGETEGYYILSR